MEQNCSKRVRTCMASSDLTKIASDPQSFPRRTFLYLLGGGAVLLGAGSSLQSMLGSSSLGKSSGLDGYHIYTVSGGYPTMDPTTYRLEVSGALANPMSLSLGDLQSFGHSQLTATFQCVTGWQVPNQLFSGVFLSDLIAKARPTSMAKFVHFTSFDNIYTESISIEDVAKYNVMVVTQLDNMPLTVEHGAPVRIFMPHNFGYKSIKWLSKIELTPVETQGYWENYGYPSNAQI